MHICGPPPRRSFGQDVLGILQVGQDLFGQQLLEGTNQDGNMTVQTVQAVQGSEQCCHHTNSVTSRTQRPGMLEGRICKRSATISRATARRIIAGAVADIEDSAIVTDVHSHFLIDCLCSIAVKELVRLPNALAAWFLPVRDPGDFRAIALLSPFASAPSSLRCWQAFAALQCCFNAARSLLPGVAGRSSTGQRAAPTCGCLIDSLALQCYTEDMRVGLRATRAIRTLQNCIKACCLSQYCDNCTTCRCSHLCLAL
eukprot:364623-Chlamydomonas_euryale.AAC.9